MSALYGDGTGYARVESNRTLIRVPEEEQVSEIILVVIWKTALGSEIISFPESSEESIPQRDVSVVEFVKMQLMMNRMMFHPPQEVTNPARRVNIAGIEVLAECRENVVPNSALDRRAEKQIEDDVGKQRVSRNFKRMLIKRRQDFAAGGTVVNLVANAPEKIRIVPRSGPLKRYTLLSGLKIAEIRVESAERRENPAKSGRRSTSLRRFLNKSSFR